MRRRRRCFHSKGGGPTDTSSRHACEGASGARRTGGLTNRQKVFVSRAGPHTHTHATICRPQQTTTKKTPDLDTMVRSKRRPGRGGYSGRGYYGGGYGPRGGRGRGSGIASKQQRRLAHLERERLARERKAQKRLAKRLNQSKNDMQRISAFSAREDVCVRESFETHQLSPATPINAGREIGKLSTTDFQRAAELFERTRAAPPLSMNSLGALAYNVSSPVNNVGYNGPAWLQQKHALKFVTSAVSVGRFDLALQAMQDQRAALNPTDASSARECWLAPLDAVNILDGCTQISGADPLDAADFVDELCRACKFQRGPEFRAFFASRCVSL